MFDNQSILDIKKDIFKVYESIRKVTVEQNAISTIVTFKDALHDALLDCCPKSALVIHAADPL